MAEGDIARLGLELDATKAAEDAERYVRALDGIDDSSKKVDRTTKNLGETMRNAARSSADVSDRAVENARRVEQAEESHVQGARRRFITLAEYDARREREQRVLTAALSDRARMEQEVIDLLHEEANALNTSSEEVDKASRKTVTGLGQVNRTLASTATQVAGLPPVLGQLTSTLGTFAVGSIVTTGALAGLAAIAVAIRAIRKEAADAEERLSAARGRLRELADEARTPIGGQTVRDRDVVGQEIERVRAEFEEADRMYREAAQGRGRAELVNNYRNIRNELAHELGLLRDEFRTATREIDEARREFDQRISDLNIKAREGHAAIMAGMAGVDPTDPGKRVRDEIRRIDEDAAIRNINQLQEEQRARLAAYVKDVVKSFEEAEKRKTAATRAAAKEREEIERETNKRIALIARGADMLGGAIGGRTGGALQGAAGGAMTGLGVAGPWGALVGGAIGAVSGLFGASKAAKEAAEQAREAARIEAEALIERRKVYEEDLRARALTLAGDEAGADLARLQAGQRRELARARADGIDTTMLEVLQGLEEDALIRKQQAEEAIRINMEQLDTLDESLSVQEQTVESLRNVVDNLRAFTDSLSLSDLSPLSPTRQYEEAQRQFQMLQMLAQQGDLSAADSLPGAARTFLSASRGMFGGTSGYVQDFEFVQSVLQAVTAGLGERLSAEELILQELQAQRDLLQSQIDEIRRSIDEANARAAEAYAQREELWRQELGQWEEDRRSRAGEGETNTTDGRTDGGGDGGGGSTGGGGGSGGGGVERDVYFVLEDVRAASAETNEILRRIEQSKEYAL